MHIHLVHLADAHWVFKMQRDSGSLCSSRMQGERGPAADQDWAGMEGLDKGEKGKGGNGTF